MSRGDVAQVVEDLLLRRAQPRPVAALREGERVQVARHVAGGARVAVVEPRAAEVGRALEDRDVRRSRGARSSIAAAIRRSRRRRSAPNPAPGALAGRCRLSVDMLPLQDALQAFSTFAEDRDERPPPGPSAAGRRAGEYRDRIQQPPGDAFDRLFPVGHRGIAVGEHGDREVTAGRSSRAVSLNSPPEGSAPVLKYTCHRGRATGGMPQLCSGSISTAGTAHNGRSARESAARCVRRSAPGPRPRSACRPTSRRPARNRACPASRAHGRDRAATRSEHGRGGAVAGFVDHRVQQRAVARPQGGVAAGRSCRNAVRNITLTTLALSKCARRPRPEPPALSSTANEVCPARPSRKRARRRSRFARGRAGAAAAHGARERRSRASWRQSRAPRPDRGRRAPGGEGPRSGMTRARRRAAVSVGLTGTGPQASGRARSPSAVSAPAREADLRERRRDRFVLGLRHEADAEAEPQLVRVLSLAGFARERDLDRVLAGSGELPELRPQVPPALDAHATGGEHLHAQDELVATDLLAQDLDSCQLPMRAGTAMSCLFADLPLWAVIVVGMYSGFVHRLSTLPAPSSGRSGESVRSSRPARRGSRRTSRW